MDIYDQIRSSISRAVGVIDSVRPRIVYKGSIADIGSGRIIEEISGRILPKRPRIAEKVANKVKGIFSQRVFGGPLPPLGTGEGKSNEPIPVGELPPPQEEMPRPVPGKKMRKNIRVF